MHLTPNLSGTVSPSPRLPACLMSPLVVHGANAGEKPMLDIKLIGVAPEILMTNAVPNIRAGTALLRQMAREDGLADSAPLSAYGPTFVRWIGYSPQVAQLLLNDVYGDMRSGYSCRAANGETIVVHPQPNLRTPALNAIPFALSAPDYPGANINHKSPNYQSRTATSTVVRRTLSPCCPPLSTSASGRQVRSHLLIGEFRHEGKAWFFWWG